MKTLRVLIIISGLVVSLVSCSPNHDEEIIPNQNGKVSGQFETKNTEGGSEDKPGTPNPK